MGLADVKSGSTPNKRRISVSFDSFLGLPPPGEKDDEAERLKNYFEGCDIKGDVAKVHQVFTEMVVPFTNV